MTMSITSKEVAAPPPLYPRANGSLPLHLSWPCAPTSFTIHGGPFRNYDMRVEDAFGVCLLEGGDVRADVHMPIPDFSVPGNQAVVYATLKVLLMAAIDGKNVYVGCAGGWGRTGLMLALVAKATGIGDPITYVREHYSDHAVETAQQEVYVDDFDVIEIRRWLVWRSWKTKLFWWLPG